MKIYVIDNTEQISPDLLKSATDVSFFTDEIQAINAIEQHAPDLIFLHYKLRSKDSARYIDLVLTISQNTNIILIGEDLSDDQVLACLLVGAKGYQNMHDLQLYIDKIIKVIAVNEAWISRRLTAKLVESIRKQHIFEDNGLYLASDTFDINTGQHH